MTTERDANGDLTDYALAMDALHDQGCDCGTDEPGTCLACVCRRALEGERRERDAYANDICELAPDGATAYESGDAGVQDALRCFHAARIAEWNRVAGLERETAALRRRLAVVGMGFLPVFGCLWWFLKAEGVRNDKAYSMLTCQGVFAGSYRSSAEVLDAAASAMEAAGLLPKEVRDA